MNNGRKKKSTFKNVMISLGCAAFAGVYGIGGCYLLTTMAAGDGAHGTLPAWMNKVEIRVNEEPSAKADGQIVPEVQKDEKTPRNDTYTDNIEQNPRFQEETQADEASADPAVQDRTELEEQETAADEEQAGSKDSKDKKAEETDADEEAVESDTSDENTDEETTVSEEDSKETASEEETEKEADVKEYVTVANVQTIQESEAPKAVVTDVTAVVRAAMPCVVSVSNDYTAYDYWYDEMVEDTICGSGIIVEQSDEELLIVTNYHVIEDNNELHVQFIDEMEATAYVKGTSPNNDLAIISVFLADLPDETLEEIAIAALGDSDQLQVGEPAIAIGNALGYGQSVTTGVISALDRTVYMIEEEDMDTESTSGGREQECLIQTDAAINPGNSGGALLNVKGEVIGINSSKIADYAIEGVGYAIPISTAKPIIDDLMQKETRKKVSEEEQGFLGIAGTDVSEEAIEKYDMPEGVYVSKVLEDTAAQKAGILKGDIITYIDGEKVTQMKSIQDLMEYYPAGTKIEVTLMRQNKGEYKEMKVNATLKHKND